MSQRLPSTYSNTIKVRITPAEFVMEFGVHFPEKPGQEPPSDYVPDVRVVLPIGALQGLIALLRKGQESLNERRVPGVQDRKKPS